MSSFKQFEEVLNVDVNRCAVAMNGELINDVCWELRRRLFWNNAYKFSLQNIVFILDNLSKSKFAPIELGGMAMGQAVLFALQNKETQQRMGTQGTAFQKQQKEVMITSGLSIKKKGTKNTITAPQRKFIHNIIPHKDQHEKNKYINQMINIKDKFEEDLEMNNFLNETEHVKGIDGKTLCRYCGERYTRVGEHESYCNNNPNKRKRDQKKKAIKNTKKKDKRIRDKTT